MISLTSPANDLFKLWKSLLTSKGLKKEGLFLFSGEKLIREFLNMNTAYKHPLTILAELVPVGLRPLVMGTKAFELSKALFEELDEVGTRYNILVIKQPEIAIWNSNSEPDGLELICPLGDPANLGALIRSAEAFGVNKVLLTEEAANPFLPKAVKASAGSLLRMPLFKAPAIAKLPENTLSNIVALDQEGTSLLSYKWNKNTRILVGEEGPGLKGFIGKNRVKIPINSVESLNAVVAASIALYDYKVKLT